MDWGAPRGTETVQVIEHHVPTLAVLIATRDGTTWVPMDVFKRYATPTKGPVIEPASEPNILRTWAAHKVEPVREFKEWHP